MNIRTFRRAAFARMLTGVVLAAGLALGASSPAAQAATAVEQLTAFLAETRSLEARFVQTLFDEESRELERSKGVMYLLRPGRFRWEYSEPFPQQIVADGERVWLYDPDLEQASVKPMADALGETPAALLSSTRPVEENFNVEDLGALAGWDWVRLTPRSGEGVFAGIDLAFANGGLVAMELRDNFGQRTRLEFSNVQVNAGLDQSLFDFEPPPGTDVIGN